MSAESKETEMRATGSSRTNCDGEIGYALLRITVGINIAMHGISRLIAGEGIFVAQLMKLFANAPLPTALVNGFAYALPWIEATIGLLILLGVKTRQALIAGALVLAVLTFGVTLLQNWTAASEQLIYAVAFYLLLTFVTHNRWSVDGLIKGR